MALKRDTRYPGRFVAANTAHPQGAFKNRSTPTSQDGSYLEADWMNDIDGFFARALNLAGTVLNGNPDTGSSSQLYDALLSTINGRLKSFQRLTTTGTYTRPDGIKFIRIRAQAGGGGGGGAGTTSSGQAAASGGGSGGFYGETSLIDVSSVTSIPYVVGVGGAGGTAGNSGTGGGLTSFGTYINVPGGTGGIPGFAVGLPQLYPDLGSFGSTSGSAVILTIAGGMGRGGIVVATTSSGCQGGKGGDSVFGRGAQTSDGGGSPGGVLSNGGGGSGAAVGPNSTSGKSGSSGGNGLIIVEEYV